ncbi:hypothetical protein HY643_00220, partial [Candidatus Woesearchaeota archaeon]|nr:hypothetical protein [Candidatus Woesearchaeota archaeon]
KKIFLLTLLIAVLFTNFASALTALFPGTDLRLNVVKYEPFPVEPGQYFDLWLKFENPGTVEYRAVKLEIIPEYPFTMHPSDVEVREFPLIGKGTSMLVKYRIKVDEKALQGSTSLKFELTVSGSKITSTPIAIDLKSKKTILTVSKVETEPSMIPPGSEGTIKIFLKNEETAALEDMVVNLKISSNLPFVPVGSISEKRLNLLIGGEERQLNFDIVTEASAEAKAYQVPLIITYYDSIGNNYSINNSIGVLIGGKPDYVLNLETSELHKAGDAGSVVISISNSGPTQLKFLSIEIVPTDKYEVIGNNREYLGNLDSDDFETAEFKVYVKDAVSEAAPLKLKIDYKDPYNKQHIDEKELELKLYTASEIRKFGLEEQGGWEWKDLWYAAIAVLVIFFLREWKIEKSIDRAVKNIALKTILAIIKVLSYLRWKNLKNAPDDLKRGLEKLLK